MKTMTSLVFVGQNCSWLVYQLNNEFKCHQIKVSLKHVHNYICI